MRKRFKKFTSLALTGALLFSMAAPGFAMDERINTAPPHVLKTEKIRSEANTKQSNLSLSLAERSRKASSLEELAGNAATSVEAPESPGRKDEAAVLSNNSDKPRKSNWKASESKKAASESSKKGQPTYGSGKGKPAYNPDELIIKFKTNTDSKTAQSVRSKHALKSKKKFSLTNAELVETAKGADITQLVEQLKKDSSVEYVQPNYRYYRNAMANDSRFGELWGLHNTGQAIQGFPGENDVDLDAPEAWDITQGSNSLVVGVIDSGIDINHPDLQSKIWVNTGEIPGDGIDNDNNGYIDDVNGWDFWHNDNTVFDDPVDDAHATHVAGTIAAAANNSMGVAGVAPNVKIMPLKFLGPEYGTTAGQIAAIQYAVNKGVKITNNSYGSYYFDHAEKNAIDAASNILFVAAAGNESYNNDVNPSYPASYTSSNILSVAAIWNDGYLTYFSNYGPTSVDVAAPGGDILSTIPKQAGEADYANAYAYANGTSMAAPHATGVAALIYSQNPSLTPAQAVAQLKGSGTPLPDLNGRVSSGKLVNAYNALTFSPENLDDDIPGTPLTQSPVNGNLHAATDKDDVYSIKLNAGETLNASLTGAAGTDFDLYLFNPSATTVNTSEGILKYSENPGTSTEQITYTAPVSGTYYLDVFAYSGSGSYTLTAGADNGPGTYQDNHKALVYQGGWQSVSNTNHSGGTVKQINSMGHVQFTFVGSKIEWTGYKDLNQGIANVYIDGNLVGSPSLYAATLQTKKSIFSQTVPYGKHTIRIDWTGKRDLSARKSGTFINIDSLIVSADTTPPAVPTGAIVHFDYFEMAPYVKWIAVTDSDLAGYHVYRKKTTDTSFTRLTTAPVTTNSYYDTTATAGNTYEYAISAIDLSGNESAKSTTATFKHDDNMPGFPITGNTASGTVHETNDIYDVWSVQLQAGQTYSFSFNSPLISNLNYYLFPAGTTDIYSASYERGAVDPGSEEYFTYPVTTAGTYYLVVEGYEAIADINYTINIGSKPTVNDNDIPGVALVNNQASDFLDYYDYDDVYKINLNSGDKITVNLSTTANNGNDFDVFLYDPTATTVDPNKAGYKANVAGSAKENTSAESFTYTATASGTYYIDVYQYKGSGPYSLSVSVSGGGSGSGGSVIIEDNNPTVAYTGTWSTSSETANSGGTFKHSSTAGHSVELTFNGTGVAILAKTSPGRGLADVFIDGTLVQTIDQYTTTTQYKTKVFEVSGLANAQHTVKMVVKGQRSSGSTANIVTLDAFVVTSPIIEDKDPAVAYTGTWATSSESANSGGTFKHSSTAGHSAELTFNGTGVAILAKTSPGRGLADVFIDGTLVQTIDQYTTTTQYKTKVFEITGLANAQHTVKMVVKGQRSSGSTANIVTLDAFFLNPTPSDTTPPVAPTGLTGSIDTNNQANLSWNANSESDLDGYIVQRASGSSPASSDYTAISDKILTTSFVDTSVTITSPYSYRVIAVDKSGNQSAPSTAITLAPPVTTLIEENSPAVAYTGTWTAVNESSNSGGTFKHSSTTSHSAELTFTGTGVAILAKTSAGRGLADVFIDGNLVQTIDQYTATTQFKTKVFEITGLSNGQHTIKMVVKGQRSPSATANIVTLDAFVVIGSGNLQQQSVLFPLTKQKTVEQPVTDQPMTDQPVTDQPTTEQPATDQPVTDQPVTDQPVTDH